MLHPPDTPNYIPLFLDWIWARRAWMVRQGYTDPFHVGSFFLAQRFGEWLRQRWPLFHVLHVGAPGTNPSGWAAIFDFWLINQHPVSSSHATPDDAGTVVTAPSVPVASAATKHYRNKTSALTVAQIQHACTVAGGEAGAVARLAAVFPPGSAVARDTLTVRRGLTAGHRGYQEFAGLRDRDGRWYCRLCGITGSRTWKNHKEILNHVWNTHCDPPPSAHGEPLSPLPCHELTSIPV